VYSNPMPILKIGLSGMLVSCMISLYTLDIHPWSDIRLENIFFHSGGHLFFLGDSFLCCVDVFYLFFFSSICLFLLVFPLPEETYPENYC